jgi:predicted HTH domain antitoxin
VVKETNMGARTLQISYPEELLEALGKTPEEFELEMKFLMAAKLYELGQITAGGAAELAEMNRVEFLEALGSTIFHHLITLQKNCTVKFRRPRKGREKLSLPSRSPLSKEDK